MRVVIRQGFYCIKKKITCCMTFHVMSLFFFSPILPRQNAPHPKDQFVFFSLLLYLTFVALDQQVFEASVCVHPRFAIVQRTFV